MHHALTLALLAAAACGGCATIVNDSAHPVKVEARTATGVMVSGAECTATNDYGSFALKSGDTAPVRRSSKDLDITCRHADQPNAVGRSISRANAGLFGNIIIGGGIGAIIDHTKGTAYTYPTWIQLVFGKTLVFDRRDEKDGQPTPGKELSATK